MLPFLRLATSLRLAPNGFLNFITLATVKLLFWRHWFTQCARTQLVFTTKMALVSTWQQVNSCSMHKKLMIKLKLSLVLIEEQFNLHY